MITVPDDVVFLFCRDLNAIESMGNSGLVEAELEIASKLSSLSEKNICPNFVITRASFTCQHKPLDSLWGSEDRPTPRGSSYNGQTVIANEADEPEHEQRGR